MQHIIVWIKQHSLTAVKSIPRCEACPPEAK